MPTDGQWREHYLRLNVRQHSGQFRLNLDLHTISWQNRVEECSCVRVTSVWRFKQRKVAGLDVDRFAGLPVFIASKRHIVDVRGKALIELAREGKAARPLDIAGKHRGDHHPPPSTPERPQQRANREDGVIQMRRNGEQRFQSKCGSARKRQAVTNSFGSNAQSGREPASCS